MDQPIYAVVKQIEWQWSESYGEEKFVLMLGGLHIEMTSLRSMRTPFQGSGWTGALAESSISRYLSRLVLASLSFHKGRLVTPDNSLQSLQALDCSVQGTHMTFYIHRSSIIL